MTGRAARRQSPVSGGPRGALLAGCIAAALVLALPAPARVSAELIDRVLASVNGEVITLSDLRQAQAFNAALGGGEAGGPAASETLEGLVNRRLILQEAARVKFEPVPDQDAADALDKLRRRLGTEEAYRKLLDDMGAGENQLRRLLKEQLVVQRFLDKKIGLFARATRDEVQEYYAGHPREFSGKSFAEVQKELTVVLSQQKAGQQLEQFIADLKGRADIRMNRLQE
jgi:hypothetical protein